MSGAVRLSGKARLRWDPWAERYILLFPERGLILNDAAYSVLALCDGARSAPEMAAILAQRYRIADTDRVLDAVSTFLQRLSSLGLIETERGGAS